jgi:hypothetical protein
MASVTLTNTSSYRVDRAPGTGEQIYCDVSVEYESGANAWVKMGTNLPPLQGNVVLLKKTSSGAFGVMTPNVTSGWQTLTFGRDATRATFSVRKPAPSVGDEYKAYVVLKASSRPEGGISPTLTGDGLAALKCKVRTVFGVGVTII